MWMTPFYLFIGLLFIYIFKNSLKLIKKNLYLFLFFSFFITNSLYSGLILNDKKRTDFPGKEIARLVQNKWDKNFINEIKYCNWR